MIIDSPKTIEDFENIRKTIFELMGSPYCDHLMFMSLEDRLEKADSKIKELKLNNPLN